MKNNAINIYGLIGKEINHSFSPKYFKKKFQKESIENTFYELFSLNKIENFTSLIREKNLRGLNVTIPYKEDIILFLDKIVGAANQIQAVNTIQFKNNKLIGYNTDVIGFENSLKTLLKKHHKKALIFGSGGASKAVVFVLEKLNIPYIIVSRKSTFFQYKDITKEIISEYTVLINTTPLGMFPNENSCVDINYKFLSNNHLVYDLIYNPKESLFLKNAKKQGAVIKNGLKMLEIQAEESWKIWNH